MEVDLTKPFRYVIYDESGTLTGSYLQILRPEHAAAYCPIPMDITWQWVFYRMNAARDDIELIPVEPPVDPEDPPVDPEPEEPVQSEPPTNP